ncbi:MAG: hypothetical protein QY322_04850 [bacterium]|nr:MAG: hypothetical protein QY322_04850 [bacterium]
MVIVGNIFLYLLSLITIWFGSGLVIDSINKFAKRLRLSPFVISFVILGLLTSIPEAAVGITSVLDGQPEIFVGNLLGGKMVIFLFIIPILAILGNGVRINHNLDSKKLLSLLFIGAIPALFAIDRNLTNFEGLIMVGLYVLVIFYIKNNQVTETQQENLTSIKMYSVMDLLKVAFGTGLVLVSSQIIVNETIYFAEVFKIPAFYISLLVLSLGTNLPELSIASRSILSGNKDIALGNYLGSSTAHTLLFGVFTIMNNNQEISGNGLLATLIFIVVGLGTFYYFSKSKNDISKKEGFILLSIYLIFVIYQIKTGFI